MVALATSNPGAFAQSLEVGRKIYEARCVVCHGSDGAGGGHGPAIVDIRRPRAASKAAGDTLRILFTRRRCGI